MLGNLSTLRRSVQSWCATGILPLRGSGITRTALDISSSERALRLAGLGTLRILARGDRKAARLDRCITQWLKIDVFFTRLPLLHIVDRFPSGDHDALGRVAHKAGDLVVTHDETAAVVFDGLEYLGLRRVSASETFFRLGCETVGALPLVRIPRAWTAPIRAGLQTRRQSILHRKVNDSASITDRQRVNHHDHGLRKKK